ncbi:MAG: MFS transporter [Candidatus Aenigmarchaeota archaeon]|nr:MFS transporter [Candidatus Aenigmarchaeota archaeon]
MPPANRKLGEKERQVLVKGGVSEKKMPYDDRAKKSMHFSTIEGALSSAASSINNSFVTPFALALKATSSEIALIASLRTLGETLAQIPGALLTQYFSRKTIWTFSTLISRILWIPILLLPFVNVNSPVHLLISLLFAVSFFTAMRAPAWSSLMGDIVPQDMRGHYFGRRNMIAGLAGLTATLVSGALLSEYGFSLIFAVSVVLGLASVYFFAKMHEPQTPVVYHYRHSYTLSLKDLAAALRINRNFVLFTLFLAAMSLAVSIAGPFFAVYMLRDLKISYLWFAALVSFEALITLIFQPYWGQLSDRYGERKILAVTGIMICFVPFIWLFVSSPGHILIANFFSSFAWAGFDLVSFNFLLAVTPSEKRPQYVANHTFLRGLATVAGSLGGYFIVAHLEGRALLFMSGLQIIFFASFLLRLASLVFMTMISDLKTKEHEIIPVRYVFWRAVAVEPAHGLKHAVEYTFRYPYELAKMRKKLWKKG